LVPTLTLVAHEYAGGESRLRRSLFKHRQDATAVER